MIRLGSIRDNIFGVVFEMVVEFGEMCLVFFSSWFQPLCSKLIYHLVKVYLKPFGVMPLDKTSLTFRMTSMFCRRIVDTTMIVNKG